jgi:hypothetical protein
MKVKVIITNRFGGWTPAALAQRLGMTLVSTGAFVGMLTPEELAEVRRSGCEYRVDWTVVTTG